MSISGRIGVRGRRQPCAQAREPCAPRLPEGGSTQRRRRLDFSSYVLNDTKAKTVPISFRTTTDAADKVKADLLAVPVFADGILGPGAEALEHALGDDLIAFMEGAGFTGKVGSTLSVPAGGGLAP